MNKPIKQLFKNSIDFKITQEERRCVLLDKQRHDRQNVQDQGRSLEEIFSRCNKVKNKVNCSWQQKQQERTERTFQEIYGVELSLQQSEWLRECPKDMSDWLLVPCPKGQRNLVVAHNRHTAVYNRLGNRVSIFQSMLPGDGTDTDALTILDCIYVREKNAFYVLDVLAFGGQQNLLYCEAEFRFFWLRSKWDELEHLEERSDTNRKPFYLVKQYDFECSSQIAECLQKYPLWPDNQPPLDGFLFYHRFASYTCGKTPLVGWLFAFMITDILGLSVSEEYKKPRDYGNPFTYMDLFDERLENKRQKNQERRERRHQKTDEDIVSTLENCSNTEENDEENTLKELLDKERALEMEQDEEVGDVKNDESVESICLTLQ